MKKALTSVFLVFLLLFSIITVSADFTRIEIDSGGGDPNYLEISWSNMYKGVKNQKFWDNSTPKASDALAVLQASVGKTGIITDELCFFYDVDYDGKVSASDALLILQVAVNKLNSSVLAIPGRCDVEFAEIPLSDELYEKLAPDYNAGGKIYEDKPSGNVIADKATFDDFISNSGIALTEEQIAIYNDGFFEKHSLFLALPDFKFEISPWSLDYAENGSMAYIEFSLRAERGEKTGSVNETPNESEHYSLFLVTVWNAKEAEYGVIDIYDQNLYNENCYRTDWQNIREPFKVICNKYIRYAD